MEPTLQNVHDFFGNSRNAPCCRLLYLVRTLFNITARRVCLTKHAITWALDGGADWDGLEDAIGRCCVRMGRQRGAGNLIIHAKPIDLEEVP